MWKDWTFCQGINSIHNCKDLDSLPRLTVLVGNGFTQKPQTINLIPDTDAEVTVAGNMHLLQLGITGSILYAQIMN